MIRAALSRPGESMAETPASAPPPSPPPPAPRRSTGQFWGVVFLVLALVVAFAVVAYLFVSSGGDDARPAGGGGGGPAEFATSSPRVRPTAATGTGPLVPQRPRVGEPAPDFALFDVREPATLRKLSDYRGQAVVVNWYASWCGPCKAEIPEFTEAQKALAGQVVFLGVNLEESPERAKGILDMFSAKYPALLDSAGQVAEHYRVSGLPATFFIDRDGILRASKLGRVTRDDLVRHLAAAGVTYMPATP